MLFGIPALLGPDFLHVLRAMGHGDEIALVDGNYPATEHGRRVIRADGHHLMPVLRAVLTLLPVEAAYRAALHNDPSQKGQIHREIDATLASDRQQLEVIPLSGDALYPRIRAAFAIVATSEPALFANVILRKGVLDPSGTIQGQDR